jgi:rhomboid protease GluP
MAFGFTPNFATDLALDQQTPQQFLTLATETAARLGWDVHQTSETCLIAFTPWSAFSWKAKIIIRIAGDSANIRSESTGNEMMDWGKNKKNVQRFIYAFNEMRNSLSPEDLEHKYEELKPQLAPSEQDTLSVSTASGKKKFGGFFSLFIPRAGYVITPILVDMNIAVFLLMALSGVSIFEPTSQQLIDWGANVRFYTLTGGWWRLITCCFVHIGILHLLFNMYALIYVGLLLEPLLGKARFIIAYLLTGIIASLTSLYWHDVTVSVGASGAIFGMYGVFLAMLTTHLIDKTIRKTYSTSILVFVAYNLIYGMKGGIDNAAHIGGLLSGIVIGYLFYPGLKQPQKTGLLYSTIGAALLFGLAVGFVIYRETPTDIVQYAKKMESFGQTEEAAVWLIKLSGNAPESEQQRLRDSGLYYWNKNIRTLNETQALNIPEALKQRIPRLIEYCNLRIAWYNAPDSMSSYYNSRIVEILDTLNSDK